MSFEELLELMRSTGIPFVAAGWAKVPEKGDYGTVAYRAFDPQFADDKVVYLERTAIVRLESRDSGEASAKLIQDALHSRDNELTWWLEVAEYDEETGLSVWEWAMLL